MSKKILASTVVGIFLLSGSAFANSTGLPKAGMTPGSFFYFFERFFEGIGTAFIFGDAAKSQRLLNLAEERLAESEVLAKEGNPKAQLAVELYKRQLAEATQRSEKASVDLTAKVTDATSKHIAILEEVMEKVPDQAKEAIARALEESKKGQIAALEAIAKKDALKSIDKASDAAHERLRKAIESFEANKPQTTKSAVFDYERIRNFMMAAKEKDQQVAGKLGETLDENITKLEELAIMTGNSMLELKDKINQAKNRSIDNQFATLKDLMKDNPEKAAEIFTKSAENRIMAAKRMAENGKYDEADSSLSDYEKYASFGKEIATLASGIRTGDTTVKELVKKATSHHITVLQNVKANLPSHAQENFNRALDSAKKVQEYLPNIPTMPSAQNKPNTSNPTQEQEQEQTQTQSPNQPVNPQSRRTQ